MINKTNKTVLLTGATGSFGRFLALELLKYNEVKLILLVRGGSLQEAKERVKNILQDKYTDNLEVFCSDLTKERLGLSESEYTELSHRTTHILHAAASVRFNHPLEEARLYNVKTTERMLGFAKECSNLARFGFVSSALVAGNRSGLILEDEFEHTAGFKNTYEQTKYEAEKMVREYEKILPIAIFRPPLIITSIISKEQEGRNDYLTLLVSLVARGLLPFVPGTKNSPMDIVDGSDVARIIVKLLLKNSLSYRTYQITNGITAFPVEVFHHMIEEKMAKNIHIEYCGNMEKFSRKLKEEVRKNPDIQIAYKRVESFLSEPACPKIFDNYNTLTELNISKIGEDPKNLLHLVIDTIIKSIQNSSIGFLVHTRYLDDVYEKFPYFRFLPTKVIFYVLEKIPPIIFSKITGLKNRKEEELKGYVCIVPLTTHQMIENRNLALVKMKKAVEKLSKKGVSLIALGGLIASFSRGGRDFTETFSDITFTTGRAYTVKTVTDYVKDVIREFNFNKSQVKISIVGAAGAIGSGCAEVLVNWGVNNLILVDLERKLGFLRNNIEQISNKIYERKVFIKETHRISDIKESDIIIAATSAPEAVIAESDLKAGAIIINDAQPSDISPEIYNRDNVLVIEGGVIRTPGIRANFNFGLADKEDNFCCLAEAFILAYAGSHSNSDINRIDYEYMEKISKISQELNFSITKYQNKFGYINYDKINKIKKILNH